MSDGDVQIEVGTLDAVEEVADMWVSLAESQRGYGSHLTGAANRAEARDTAARRAVTGGLLVARDERRLVGFVTFSKEQGSFDQELQRGLVHDLFVHATHRGRGIGSRLLATAERKLAGEGCDVVSLETLAANDRARAFYRDNGYTPHRVELEKPLESDTSTTEES